MSIGVVAASIASMTRSSIGMSTAVAAEVPGFVKSTCQAFGASVSGLVTMAGVSSA